MNAPRTALVTGANRGIGLAVATELANRGLRVVLSGRDLGAVEEATAQLRLAGQQVEAAELDVGEPESVRACAERLRAAGTAVDVLIQNAALCPSGGVLDTPPEQFLETLRVNFVGAWELCRAFVPAMLERGYGRIVHVSSGWGAFAEGLDGPAAYSISKAALNALTLRLARELKGDVKVNAVCPGWVRTRLGGLAATRSPEEGAASIVWLATLAKNGPNGGFFRDRQRIDW